MTALLTETDWTHVENILGGAAFFVGFMTFLIGMYLLMRDEE